MAMLTDKVRSPGLVTRSDNFSHFEEELEIIFFNLRSPFCKKTLKKSETITFFDLLSLRFVLNERVIVNVEVERVGHWLDVC